MTGTLIFLMTGVCQQPSGEVKFKVWNLAVATSDRTVESNLREEFVPGTSLDDLTKRIGSPRFRLRTFGARSCVAIDSELPIFRETQVLTKACRAVSKGVDSSGKLNLDALSKVERSDLMSALERTYPGRGFAQGGSGHLGVLLTSSVTLDDGIRTATVRVDASDRHALAAWLKGSPAKAPVSEAAMKKAVEARGVQHSEEHSFPLRFLGEARKYSSEALEASAQAVREISLELAKAHASAAWEVGQKMALSKAPFPVAGNWSDLTAGQRGSITERLQMEKVAFGMSGEEAKAFSERIRAVRSSTAISVAFCVKGASNGPPVFYSLELGSYTDSGRP